MENASVGQLVRKGAYEALGAMLLYGVLALAVSLIWNPMQKPTKTSSPTGGCGCGGH
jgi:hypothetical protein